MPYPVEHRQETRDRILASARRLFNRHGLSAVSIDAIMEGAGLTHGGFYSYFDSKEDLYAEAITLFARRFPSETWQSIARGPVAEGTAIARMIVDAYLSRAHFDDVEGSCPMIGLPNDVAHGGAAAKRAFRQVLEMMVEAFEDKACADRRQAHERALAVAALCVGGMVLARAVDDPRLADDLREAARTLALATGGWAAEPVPHSRPDRIAGAGVSGDGSAA